MKTLIFFFILIYFSPTIFPQEEWVNSYYNQGDFYGFHFTDTLHGWFTHTGPDKIVYTSDGGLTFEVKSVLQGSFELWDIYMEDSLNGWAAGNSYIFRTNDGGNNWTQLTHPASQSIFSQIEKVGQSIWIFGFLDLINPNIIILKTWDSGATWQLTEFQQFNYFFEAEVFDSLNFIIASSEGVIARTTDGGMTWNISNFGPFDQIERIAFKDQNIGYVLSTHTLPPYSVLYKSEDGGFSWSIQYNWIYVGQKQGLSLIPGTNSIYVAGHDGESSERAIMKSIDSGNNWITFSTEPHLLWNIFTPDEDHGWAAGLNAIFRCDHDIRPNYPPYFTTSVEDTIILVDELFEILLSAQDPNGDSLTFTALHSPEFLELVPYGNSNRYILLSGTPTIADTGYYFISIMAVDSFGASDTLSWELQVRDNPLGIELFFDIPGEVTLQQNYPNPFNPVTKIKFTIPTVERFAESLKNNNERIGNSLYNVTLKVYDVLGNEIETLVNEEKPAGSYEVEWNASDLPSGIYFYQLTAGEFVETKKMILLK